MAKTNPVKIPSFEKWPDWVIFLIFFTYSIIIGFLVQFILLPYIFPSWHAGEGLLVGLDSRGFHREALEIAQRISTEGWQAWAITQQPVAGIAGIFYALLAPHPWVMLPLNSLLHALAAWILFKAPLHFINKRIHAFLAALPLFIFPSALSWVTQMHNDNYAVAGAILILYAWVCFAREESWKNPKSIMWALLALVGGIGLTWLVRDYVVSMYTGMGALLLAFCLVIFLVRFLRHNWNWKRSLVATGVVLLAFFLTASVQIFNLGASEVVIKQGFTEIQAEASSTGTSVDQNTELQPGDKGFRVSNLWTDTPWLPRWIDRQLEQLSITRYKAIRSTWTATRGGSNIDTDVYFRNALDIIQYVPRAIEIGFFSPFPGEWFQEGSKAPNTMMRRVSGLEMVYIYLSYVGLLTAIWTWRKHPEFWAFLLFGVGMVYIYTLGTPNIGTLYRLRYPVLMAVVGLGTGGWIAIVQWLRSKKKVLKSMSR